MAKQKELAEGFAKPAPRYKMPELDPEVKRLADEQANRAKDYRSKMGTMREEQFGQAEQQSRRGLAQSLAGNKANYAGRGLLFSGMKVGGERILVVPPAMAYGAQKVGPIPANSTLVFAITLLEIE